MKIERLTPSAAPAYRALMLQAYAAHPDAFTSSVTERAALPMSWWEARLSTDPLAHELVLAAVDGEDLAGVVGLSFDTREKARHKVTLLGMYVAQRYRQQGLARQLMLAALAQVRQRDGVRMVQLTVTYGNRVAQALYEACGFTCFGIEPQAVAVGDRFVAKVHMSCDLRGEATPPAAAELLATVSRMEARLATDPSTHVQDQFARYRVLTARFDAELGASPRDVALAKSAALMLVQANRGAP